MVPGLLFLYRNQGAMIARWRQEPVPIVLVPTAAEDEVEIPFIFEYLRSRYRDAGVIELDRGPMRVFVDEGRQPVGTFGATGLPCFR